MPKTFIIHPGCIERDLIFGELEPDLELAALVSLGCIRDTIDGAQALIAVDELATKPNLKLDQVCEGDVYLLKTAVPGRVGELVESGEAIELMGAYTPFCLSWAKDVAEAAGAKVTISEIGAFYGDQKEPTGGETWGSVVESKWIGPSKNAR